MVIYLVYLQLKEPYVIAAFSMRHKADLFAEKNDLRFVQEIVLDGELK